MNIPQDWSSHRCYFVLLCYPVPIPRINPDFSGHWEGFVKVAGQDFPVSLDSDKR